MTSLLASGAALAQGPVNMVVTNVPGPQFNADAYLVPDLDAFVADIGASFEELRSAVVAQHLASRTAEPEIAPPVTCRPTPARPASGPWRPRRRFAPR